MEMLRCFYYKRFLSPSEILPRTYSPNARDSVDWQTSSIRQTTHPSPSTDHNRKLTFTCETGGNEANSRDSVYESRWSQPSRSRRVKRAIGTRHVPLLPRRSFHRASFVTFAAVSCLHCVSHSLSSTSMYRSNARLRIKFQREDAPPRTAKKHADA